MSATPDFEDELRHHAVALRGLARDLLRDPHLADDVAQETLHRALAQRDLRQGPLGGWLHRTLVNFARQWRRGERRRAARHAALGAPEPPATPPETLSRRETLLGVSHAVLALDEPYQTAIFLRYFEDLPPRTIAARTGANLATVKSRLQRGLALLRERLDRGGDRAAWRAALLTTFGLPVATVAGATLTTGAFVLATTTKVLCAAGLLGLGGLFVYGFGQEAPPRPAAQAPGGGSASGTPATGAVGDAPEAAARESAPAAPTAEPWLDHPYLLALEVRIVDATGLPVEGHRLRLAPPGCTLNDAPQATGPDGTVALSWRSRLPHGEVVIADERGTVRRHALQHGVTTRLVLPGRTRQRNTVTLFLSRSREQAPVLAEIPLAGRLASSAANDAAGLRQGLHPFAVFETTSARLTAEAADEVLSMAVSELSFSLDVAEFSNVRAVRGKLRVAGSTDAQTGPPPQARIAGTVFGEDGRPAAKTPIALLGSGPQPVQRTETDDAGQFAFESLLAAEFTVRAGGADAGLATVAAVTTTGTTPVTLHLRTGSCVRGKALGATGQPLAGATISWRASDGSWCDEARSRDDGSFVLANLPGTAGDVLLWTPGDDHRLPVARAANVLCDTGELVLRAEPAAGALRLEVAPPDGAGDVAVRAWNLDLGLATRLPDPDEGQPRRLANLIAGWYRLEIHHPAVGWFDAGRHWIDGKTDCDLGRVVLPPTATVGFALPADELPPADQQAFEIAALRRDVDVRIEQAAPDDKLLLPAGDYVMAWRGKDGAVHFHRFAAAAGRETTVAPGR